MIASLNISKHLSLKNLNFECKSLNCYLEKDKTEIIDGLYLNRISINNYQISNKSNKNIRFILPFNNQYKLWKTEKTKT